MALKLKQAEHLVTYGQLMTPKLPWRQWWRTVFPGHTSAHANWWPVWRHRRVTSRLMMNPDLYPL